MGSFFVAIKQRRLVIPLLSNSLCHWFWLWACTILMRGCWSTPLVFSHSSHTVLFQTNVLFFCFCFCCLFFFSLKKSFVYIVLVCLVFRQQKLKITFQFKHSSIVCVSYYRCVNASLPVCKMLSIRWLAWWIGGDFIGLNWVLTLSPAPS